MPPDSCILFQRNSFLSNYDFFLAQCALHAFAHACEHRTTTQSEKNSQNERAPGHLWNGFGAHTHAPPGGRPLGPLRKAIITNTCSLLQPISEVQQRKLQQFKRMKAILKKRAKSTAPDASRQAKKKQDQVSTPNPAIEADSLQGANQRHIRSASPRNATHRPAPNPDAVPAPYSSTSIGASTAFLRMDSMPFRHDFLAL